MRANKFILLQDFPSNDKPKEQENVFDFEKKMFKQELIFFNQLMKSGKYLRWNLIMIALKVILEQLLISMFFSP